MSPSRSVRSANIYLLVIFTGFLAPIGVLVSWRAIVAQSSKALDPLVHEEIASLHLLRWEHRNLITNSGTLERNRGLSQPGSSQALLLIVSNILAARQQLVAHGACR
jgi:hypothetical protein